MRLREKDLETVYLKQRIVSIDEEGEEVTEYADESKELEMNVQSAGGKTDAATYGERLPYIKSCKYQGDKIKEGKNEKDGICLYVGKEEKPDFEIIAIQTFSAHVNVTLERL
ncbi:hypothetical protein IW492_02675 [Enterococcus sp. BWB1-3]|uniref:hypothetical protein n=1 Tax=Enterococcus sp. BWB1-3 TaxID=2787713 RepID=UPI0019215831|nr:hypothetical protein [Enterococcus sp. BWB1-3]MBL1228136.1 hypothetical protein [Enterococcus sp. BWB1-3]